MVKFTIFAVMFVNFAVFAVKVVKTHTPRSRWVKLKFMLQGVIFTELTFG